MQNTDILKIRNNTMNQDLLDRAKAIKWAITSRIRQFTIGPEIACNCVAYIASKVYGKFNNPKDIRLNEALNEIKDRELINYLADHVTKEIWDAAKDVCFGTSLDLVEMIPFLQEEYEGRFGEYSTPKTVGDLARALLDVSNKEKVADICCGKGNFLLDTYLENPKNKYFGKDINTDCIYQAKIRFGILEDSKNITVKQCNIFEEDDQTKYDKIFSNYPFAMRIKQFQSMEYYVMAHQEYGITTSASAEWLFNILIRESLAKNGKAVVIMSNGTLFRLGADEEVRKNFVENGYVETVIALPKNMYDYTPIPTTMLVLGSNTSKKIKFVDASECYEKTRRLNVFSKKNIEEILKATKKDSNISKTISYKEIADNDYNLTPQRYLRSEDMYNFKNGVEFEKIIKNITRGAGISAAELDKIASVDETDYQYVMLANIKGGIIDSKLPYIKEIPGKYERYCIKNNNLLLSKNGAPYKVAVATVKGNKKILANGNLFVIELDEDKVDPHYLKAFFNSQEGNKLLASLSTNGTIPSISVNDLKKVQIPLPPLKRQKEIANKFLTVEDEIKVLELKINKCREKLVGIFNSEEDA